MIAADSAFDANLLVGLLALQTQLISRPELVAAVRQWIAERTPTLGEILVARRALRAGDLNILKALRDRLLERHGGDVDQALAALSCLRGACAALEDVADATLRACLTRVCALAGSDSNSVVAEPSAPVAPTDPATLPAPPAQLATSAAPVPVAPVVPSSSARFRIERLLVEGNLGSLYLARDLELARDVVVKQIHARYADDPEAQARFHREIKYASELEHAGIVPIYGAGCYSDARRYYVMRYIKGEDLRAAIDRCHQLSRSERMHQVRLLIGRFAAVCRAIAYAHDRRVLHRDIKPENIRLSEDGETIVVDWGLAKSIDSSSTAGAAEATLVHRDQAEYNPTKQFQAIGTPAYMSPETAGGELDRVGPRSDVYSLGATLYDLLTGKPPFSKSEARSEPILTKVQKGEFRRPRDLWQDVPRELEAICLKAMAVTPEKRYRSAQALAEDLERWQEGEPVHALPESSADRLVRRLRKRPLRLATAAALIFTAVGASGMAALDLHRESESPEPAAALHAARADLETAELHLVTQKKQHAADKASLESQVQRAQDKYYAEQRRAEEAHQKYRAAGNDRDEWKTKYTEKVTELQGQIARKTDELQKALAANPRGQEQVKTFIGEASTQFDDTYRVLKDAFGAFETRLQKPKSHEAEFDRRVAFARLQRYVADMYVLLENHGAADQDYRNAIATLKDMETGATTAKGPLTKELIQIRKELAYAGNGRGWLFATSACAAKRDGKLAVKLVEEAITTWRALEAHISDRDEYLRNYDAFQLASGVARYRAGDFKAARDILWRIKDKLAANPDYYDMSLLFVAMADFQLQNGAEAIRSLGDVERRMSQKERHPSRELERVRAEAEALLADLRKGR